MDHKTGPLPANLPRFEGKDNTFGLLCILVTDRANRFVLQFCICAVRSLLLWTKHGSIPPKNGNVQNAPNSICTVVCYNRSCCTLHLQGLSSVCRELLGYVREEHAPSDATASAMTTTIASTTVNESILPNANPDADEAMRKQMENLRKARGPSLLEQHQRKQAAHANDGVSTTQNSGGWNRFVDYSLTQRDSYVKLVLKSYMN